MNSKLEKFRFDCSNTARETRGPQALTTPLNRAMFQLKFWPTQKWWHYLHPLAFNQVASYDDKGIIQSGQGNRADKTLCVQEIVSRKYFQELGSRKRGSLF